MAERYDNSGSERESEVERRNQLVEEEQGRLNATTRQRVGTRISKTELMERIDVLENDVAVVSAELQANRRELDAVVQENQRVQERMSQEIQFLRDLITRGVLGGGGAGYTPSQPKLKVREPDTYDGVRNDKVLGNFFFDMEEYLDNLPGLTDEAQVRTAARYLIGSAKLWWRTRAEDKAAGRDVVEIDTWDQLKQALKDQFLPGNSAWVARNKLMNLKHTGKVSDYVKTFSSLMLEIKDMVEEDRLFHFMRGLQYWAQEELRRARVKTLAEAIQEAERLMDFRSERTNRPPASPPKSHGADKGKQPFRSRDRPNQNNQSKTKGRSSYQSRKNFISGSSSEGSVSGGNRSSKGSRRSHHTGRRTEQKNSPPSKTQARKNCYVCGGDHWRFQCPQQKPQANAIEGEGSESDSPRMTVLRCLNSGDEELTPEEAAELATLAATCKTVASQKSKDRGKALADESARLASMVVRSPESRKGSNRSRSPTHSSASPRRKVEKIESTSKYVDTDGRNRRLFLVKWKHAEKRTWEPAETMVKFDDKVQEFFERCEASRKRREAY